MTLLIVVMKYNISMCDLFVLLLLNVHFYRYGHVRTVGSNCPNSFCRKAEGHILRGTRNLSFLTYIKCIIFLVLPCI